MTPQQQTHGNTHEGNVLSSFFSADVFWDVDVHTLDLYKHQQFIIERISQRGRWADWKKLLAFYGNEAVKTSLVNARTLDKKTLAYCSSYFDIPKEMFRCFSQQQSTQQHWNF